MALNLDGTFYCCRAVGRVMKARNQGRIVNMSSIGGKEGNANASCYAAAKAGVIALTKAFGKELALMNQLEARLEEVARDIRPDIIHAHSPVLNALPAIKVARKLGIPVYRFGSGGA